MAMVSYPEMQWNTDIDTGRCLCSSLKSRLLSNIRQRQAATRPSKATRRQEGFLTLAQLSPVTGHQLSPTSDWQFDGIKFTGSSRQRYRRRSAPVTRGSMRLR